MNSRSFRSKPMNNLLANDELRSRLSRIMYNCDQDNKKTQLKLLSGENLDGCLALQQNKSVVPGKKGSERSYRIANAIKEHVKGKLSLGAKILQLGGMKKAFKRLFNVKDGERLLKASQCCLYTTAGPIAGILFISTNKLAFCSNKSVVNFASPTGESLGFHYKVVIPLRNIDRGNQLSESKNRTSKKYLQIVTTDNFEFWFMGFLSYNKTYKCLQQAISKV